nr:MAG TPA: hypothetical protein [Caudoviricetes sp.]
MVRQIKRLFFCACSSGKGVCNALFSYSPPFSVGAVYR